MASSSAAEVADKFGRLALSIQRGKRTTVTDAALVVKDEFVAGMKRAGVTPGVSKIAGGKANARFDIKGAGNPTALVKYRGAFHLVENDTKRHFIGARKLGTRRGLAGRAREVGVNAAFGGSNRGAFGSLRQVKNGKRALTVGGNLRAYAFHPGTRGKNTWPETKRRSADAAVKTLKSGMRTNMIKAGFGR